MAKTTVFQARLRDFDSVDGGGLNLTVKSGRIRDDATVTDKAEQTVVLTDNATNFVEIDSTGSGTANTSAFTSGRIPIATVVTASGSISSITDKRAWTDTGTGATPAFGRVRASNSNISTTSTTSIDVPGVTLTKTTGANPIMVGWMTGVQMTGTPPISMFFTVDVDGTKELGDPNGHRVNIEVVGTTFNINLTLQTLALTAASHTVKLKFRVTAETGFILGGDDLPFMFTLFEIA